MFAGLFKTEILVMRKLARLQSTLPSTFRLIFGIHPRQKREYSSRAVPPSIEIVVEYPGNDFELGPSGSNIFPSLRFSPLVGESGYPNRS